MNTNHDMEPILRQVRERQRQPQRSQVRVRRARNVWDAEEAAKRAESWLDELACMPQLDGAGEHAVAEALHAIRAVRGYLRRFATAQTDNGAKP